MSFGETVGRIEVEADGERGDETREITVSLGLRENVFQSEIGFTGRNRDVFGQK